MLLRVSLLSKFCEYLYSLCPQFFWTAMLRKNFEKLKFEYLCGLWKGNVSVVVLMTNYEVSFCD
jgi:hypothetical protein